MLAKDGKVSAILDWSCCRIGDPAMDVAFTLVLDKASTKHVIPSFDPKIETRKYLEAYKRERELNERNLEYHCHLTYRYGACWSCEKDEIEIEVYYAGSREKAPY